MAVERSKSFDHSTARQIRLTCAFRTWCDADLSRRSQLYRRHARIGNDGLFREWKAQPLLAGEAPGGIAEMGRGGVVRFRMREHGVRLHAVRVERNNLQIARAVAAAIDRVAACIDRMERTHHREVTRFVAAAKERHTLAVPVDVQQFPTRGVERKTVTLHGEHRAAKRLLKSGFKRGIGGVETA